MIMIIDSNQIKKDIQTTAKCRFTKSDAQQYYNLTKNHHGEIQ